MTLEAGPHHKGLVYSSLSHPLLFFPRPLHLAARNGLATVVQALLSRGATVLAVDEEGESYLCLVSSFQLIPSDYR